MADIIEFIVMCARRGRGIHPGFNVALNLIFWIVSICMAAFTDNGASALLAINSERNGPNTAHPIDEDDITLFRTFGRTYRIVAALFGVMMYVLSLFWAVKLPTSFPASSSQQS